MFKERSMSIFDLEFYRFENVTQILHFDLNKFTKSDFYCSYGFL